VNQNQFEHTYRKQWDQFQQLLEILEKKEREAGKPEVPLSDFPQRYRQVCNHYGLAQTRHYSPALVDMLHGLVLRGHRQLYREKTGLLWKLVHFLVRDFPRTVRQNGYAFWLAFLLFYGPAVAIGTATYHDSVLIYSLMGEDEVTSMETMYNPNSEKVGRSQIRSSETNFSMFGYYILNNISIGFRTFAGGIVFGVGAVFLLLFNGLMIGGVTGHLSHAPYSLTFWQFVLGHGAFELTAIVISGAAGLVIGSSILRPGPYRRLDSLRLKAPVALRLVMGAALMLVCAAFIEAFWSPVVLPQSIKLSVAGVNWTLVTLYLLLMGRNSRNKNES
jgi:uncharacterized membrane protein SpoIIM required for sporulation